MRPVPSVLHVDLDAFFAAVEQRDKPSLRGKPVVVGGTGGRGVVATASYEARVFGVRSAMSTREARSRCPHAAYLRGRFEVYREASAQVMGVLRAMSPLVEPLSLDEAFVDLAAAGVDVTRASALVEVGERLRADVAEVTGGLTCSVGIASSKLVAKIASELDKPDGLAVVPAGTEIDLLRPMPATALPGVGPATADRLRRAGVVTIGDLAATAEDDLVALLGQAAGHNLARLALARDDREVVSDREAKSVSNEDTYETDIADPRVLAGLVDQHARRVAARLRAKRISGRTVTTKVKLHDFSVHSRSQTLATPTDDPDVISRHARALLGEVETASGVRLLGVGISGLADWIQDELFATGPEPDPVPAEVAADETRAPAGAPAGTAEESVKPTEEPAYAPGTDVVHDEHGPGWVWGSGLGRVTVRFETALTGPGPVRTFALDDPALAPLTRSAPTTT
ncbi:DNA polymerase IV [Nocardioidaceae bacterium]|nr:DNA polymerase IV [Nocardioidaceae bacterium]